MRDNRRSFRCFSPSVTSPIGDISLSFWVSKLAGIGEATAALLSNRGARVAIADVNDVQGQEFAARLGSDASYHHCDMTCVFARPIYTLCSTCDTWSCLPRLGC